MARCYSFFQKADPIMCYRARQNAVRSVYYWNRPARKYIEEMYGAKEIIRVI
ncbi:MAG: hypothetical protein ACOC7U_01220 [Spirochaetota bacterium]